MGRDNITKILERQPVRKLVFPVPKKLIKKGAMSRPNSNLPKPGTQADRASKIRLAMGYQTKKAFAKRYGFTTSQWSNYEYGWPIPYKTAQSLARQIGGLSVLWILEGDESGLSLEMARKLGILPPDAS
jgi:hypothetical protein